MQKKSLLEFLLFEIIKKLQIQKHNLGIGKKHNYGYIKYYSIHVLRRIFGPKRDEVTGD
jgi:hypothetical protein